jgi:hypothetical protein
VRGWLRWAVHGEQETAAELKLAGAAGDGATILENEIVG